MNPTEEDAGLPSDAEIAAELGISVKTVAKKLEEVARDIIADSFDIEMIPRRGRIFIWYRHQLWERRQVERDERRTASAPSPRPTSKTA